VERFRPRPPARRLDAVAISLSLSLSLSLSQILFDTYHRPINNEIICFPASFPLPSVFAPLNVASCQATTPPPPPPPTTRAVADLAAKNRTTDDHPVSAAASRGEVRFVVRCVVRCAVSRIRRRAFEAAEEERLCRSRRRRGRVHNPKAHP